MRDDSEPFFVEAVGLGLFALFVVAAVAGLVALVLAVTGVI